LRSKFAATSSNSVIAIFVKSSYLRGTEWCLLITLLRVGEEKEEEKEKERRRGEGRERQTRVGEQGNESKRMGKKGVLWIFLQDGFQLILNDAF
jgi:hypothetical protein